jgi:predicted RNase H-like HicB family nuclease
VKIFYGIVHKDEDSAYGVTFPDLPGCFSAADDDSDIIANAAEALELYFEDSEEVEPSSLQAVFELALKDQDSAARSVVAVPYIKSTRKTVRANISLESGLLDAIDVVAKQRRLTRSAFIAEAVQKEIVGAH